MSEPSACEVYEVKIKSIKDRLSPSIQAIMDKRLPRISSTVITVMTRSDGRHRFPEPEEPTPGTHISKKCLCKYLSKVVDSKNGEIDTGDIQRFERLIAYLIEMRLVAHGVLADPLCIPMINNRAILTWYVFSDHTRDELNEKLGCECFVDEGEMYDGEWPKVALE